MAKRNQNSSIRTFDRRLKSANEKREKLATRGEFSLPSEMGRLAIVVSDRPNYMSAGNASRQFGISYEDYIRQEIESFEKEAERIKNDRGANYESVIRLYATDENLGYVFRNRTISDVVVIGHGSINSIWSRGAERYYDWVQASNASNHLKLGVIEQRMCGGFPMSDGRNAPLGSFVVRTLSNVWAAVGVDVPDSDPGEGLFQPVFNDDNALISQIHSLNKQHIAASYISEVA